MSLFYKNESANSNEIDRYIRRFRKKYIPERYNQVKMLDYLQDDEVYHYVSISNRADGKSFNYLHFFMRLAIDYDVGFLIITRHWTLQKSYVRTLNEIAKMFNDLDPKLLYFRNSDFYIRVMYKGDDHDLEIGLISDLTQVSDLKNESSYLANFPLIIFDEFLVFESEYFPDEYERLSLLYSSVNRRAKGSIPVIHNPKVFYLGNSINFSSPVLLGLNLFNRLEKQPLNSIYKYNKVVLEINKNEHANEDRVTEAFDEQNDNLANVVFTNNYYLIASEAEKKDLRVFGYHTIVKLKRNYLFIYYDYPKGLIMLSIHGFSKDYQYNLYPVDNKETSIYLKDSYFSNEYKRRFIVGRYKYDNVYTKSQVTNDSRLMILNISRIVREDHSKKVMNTSDSKQEKFKDDYIARTKAALLRRWL